MLWHSDTGMGCFQNGIALSLPPAAAAAATRAAAHVLEPGPFTLACNPFACLLPWTRCHHNICLFVQDPSARTQPGTGQPDSRTIGQSARPIADLDPDGQNSVPVPDQSGGSTDDFK